MDHNLKLIVHWLRANRISLNVDKTEIVINKRYANNKKYELSNKWLKDTTQNTNQLCRPSITIS